MVTDIFCYFGALRASWILFSRTCLPKSIWQFFQRFLMMSLNSDAASIRCADTVSASKGYVLFLRYPCNALTWILRNFFHTLDELYDHGYFLLFRGAESVMDIISSHQPDIHLRKAACQNCLTSCSTQHPDDTPMPYPHSGNISCFSNAPVMLSQGF